MKYWSVQALDLYTANRLQSADAYVTCIRLRSASLPPRNGTGAKVRENQQVARNARLERTASRSPAEGRKEKGWEGKVCVNRRCIKKTTTSLNGYHLRACDNSTSLPEVIDEPLQEPRAPDRLRMAHQSRDPESGYPSSRNQSSSVEST